MKKKVIPIIIVIILVLLIVLGMFVWQYYVDHYVPTDEEVDLYGYFGVTEADDVAVIKNGSMERYFAKIADGHVYLSYDLVHDMNDRFYLDKNENLLIYCTDKDLISMDLTDTENHYYLNHSPVPTEYPVLRMIDSLPYLALDFIQPYTDFVYEYFEEPSRIVVHTQYDTFTEQQVVEDTEIRLKGGIKSPILAHIPAGSMLEVLDEEENWTHVADNTGIKGYVPKDALGEKQENRIVSTYQEPAYEHILMDKTVCLLWHQVTSPESNEPIRIILPKAHGVNVMSPTWFYLNDNAGGIADLGSLDYVTYCHEQGVQVWGLVSNLENPEADDDYMLSHTSVRRVFEDNVIAMADKYGLDGINIDFEAIPEEYGEDYVQMIRELSQKCAEHNLILSVDTYVPMDYSYYYNRAEQGRYADYVIIMGYDEHYAGGTEGSVASLPFVRNGVQDTLDQGVAPEQLVLGMPFFTRIWKEEPKSEAASDLEMASDEYVPYDLSSQAVGMFTQNQTVKVHEAPVTWLEEMGQNYAEYESEGATFKIWMEDLMSLEKKLQVVQEKGIAGGAFWKAELETEDVWNLIPQYLQ